MARSIDLERSTYAFALLKMAADHFVWYHRYHHIAIDYYGTVLITERLADVYTALATGQPPRAACPRLSIVRPRLAWDPDR